MNYHETFCSFSVSNYLGYTNWREGGERDREKEKDIEDSEPNKDRRWISRVGSMHSQTNRRNFENKENNLPEW